MSTHAGRLRTYASFVKLEHTIFSLPVVFAGTVLGRRGWPSSATLWFILLAAIGGRVAGMAINRLIDADIDRRNPRTKLRELPRGAMHRREAWAVVVVACLVYFASAAALSPICLALSPIPLALFVGYPYLKRFTSLCHLGLGLAWSMGPLGGWLAVSQSPDRFGEVVWLWLFSWLWVAGFDIIYATMDEGFDREFGIHSLPARLGRHRALLISAGMHLLAFLCLVVLWREQLDTGWALIWLITIGIVLAWEQAVANKHPEFAFFKLNGAVGFLVFGMIVFGV